MNLTDTGSFATVRKQIKDVQPIIASLPLTKFSFGRNQTIFTNGTPLKTNEDAYYKFIKRVLGAPPGFIKKFKGLTNEKTQLSMLETLIAGNVKKNKGNVILVGNPETGEVTAFDKETNSFKTHDQTLDFAERILNIYPNLEMKKAFVDEVGALNIIARHRSEYGEINGEEHRGGISIVNSYDKGCKIYHNLLRCVCTNGMIIESKNSLNFDNSARGLSKLFVNLDGLNENSWINPKYWDNVRQAMNLDASLAEVDFMRTALLKTSDIGQFNPEQLELFIPINKIKHYLVKRGINYEKLNQEQMKNCPTGVKLWDLINRVTDFASHNYGFKIVERERMYLQTIAGDMVNKRPDAMGFLNLN